MCCLLPGASAWFSCKTDDGQTPAQFAALAECCAGDAERLQGAMMRAMAQGGSGGVPAGGRPSSSSSLSAAGDAAWLFERLVWGFPTCEVVAHPSGCSLVSA